MTTRTFATSSTNAIGQQAISRMYGEYHKSYGKMSRRLVVCPVSQVVWKNEQAISRMYGAYHKSYGKMSRRLVVCLVSITSRMEKMQPGFENLTQSSSFSCSDKCRSTFQPKKCFLQNISNL